MNHLSKIIILFFVFAFVGTSSAAVLEVSPSSHYKSVQAAVNDADTGDTIIVAYGTYPEKVDIKGKHIDLQGKWSKNKYPKINGFECSEGGTAKITGFNIVKFGISCHDGSMGNYIRNNIFTNCGIDVFGTTASETQIINCKVTGGTIYFFDTYSNKVTGCTFTNCNPAVNCGDMGNVAVTKNTFTGNKIGVLRVNGSGYLKDNKYSKNTVNIKNVNI